MSELDSASITTLSVVASTVSSEDSDKIAIPSVADIHIHDDPIPVETERDLPTAAVVDEVLPIPAAQEPPQQPEARQKPEIIRVDRSKLTFRTPKSTQGGKSAALQKTLITAIESRKSTIVEQLLDRGVSPDTGTEKNAVVIAAWYKDSPTLKLLLEFGADPNESKNADGTTALRATCEGRPEQAEMLLQWGADPNQFGPSVSPLNSANDTTSGDIVRMLLRYGADPNMMDKNRQIPLSNACIRPNEPELLQEYILYGADINLKNGDGWTALEAACCHNRPEYVSK